MICPRLTSRNKPESFEIGSCKKEIERRNKEIYLVAISYINNYLSTLCA